MTIRLFNIKMTVPVVEPEICERQKLLKSRSDKPTRTEKVVTPEEKEVPVLPNISQLRKSNRAPYNQFLC